MDVVYDAVIGAVAIKQVKRTSFKAGVQSQSLRLSGGLDPQAIVVQGGEPRATFESMDIAGVLTGLGVSSGLFVVSGSLLVPWNRRANGGTFAGGSNNFTLSGANGLAIINSLSASQGDEGAVAEVELCFLSADGLAAPVAANVNQALSAEAYNAAWAMGPVYVNAVQLAQVSSIRVNTGLQLVVKRYDGSVYPTFAFIQERNPSIDITFENFDALSTQGPLFSATTNAAVYFRKKADGGTFVSDASTVHVQASFASGLTAVENADGDGTSNGSATIRFIGKTLAVSTAHAIP